MKIIFIDNMNNNFFSMARYLRDLGYDIVVSLGYSIVTKRVKRNQVLWVTFRLNIINL